MVKTALFFKKKLSKLSLQIKTNTKYVKKYFNLVNSNIDLNTFLKSKFSSS